MAEILEPTLTLNYTGKVQPPPGHEDEKGLTIYPYLPSPELVEAVNLAITLQRPLLLQGEPGSGKTKLAQAVAFELKLPYLSWNIKSTSKAQDGLYTYNNLGRLRDAQLLALNRVTDPEEIQRLDDPKTYRDWGPMGQAFMNEQRTVLLIDEIDKADIDFPNDLLLELDEKRFTIPETKEEIIAKHPPIIFITSNAERDLPDAFLRRCLFHYIEFPQRERLIEIVLAHFNISEDNPVIDLIETAVDKFSELREFLQEEKGQGAKKVSTSELIDWFDILRRYPQDEVRSKLNGRLPYLGVLLKRWDDYRRYLKRDEE